MSFEKGIKKPVPAGSERDQSIDVARGLAMLYIVVFIHGIFWLSIFDEQFRSMFLFEMPVIFAISGYSYALFERKGVVRLNWRDYSTFLTQRFARILLPYLAYAAVCFAVVAGVALEEGASFSFWRALAAWVNPVQRGIGYSVMMLNLHLWFIAPFLVVTALMPFITKLPSLLRMPWTLWMLLLAGMVYLLDAVPGTMLNPVQTSLFYLAWSVFGFSLAKRSQPLRIGELVVPFVLALSILFCLPHLMLNMQVNKAPPNWIFAIFTSCWMAGLLFLSSRFDRAWVSGLASKVWLKPYIQYGYSIYLWQGLGYSIAVWIGRKEGLPTVAILGAAVILSTVLGMLASPLERVRFRMG